MFELRTQVRLGSTRSAADARTCNLRKQALARLSAERAAADPADIDSRASSVLAFS